MEIFFTILGNFFIISLFVGLIVLIVWTIKRNRDSQSSKTRSQRLGDAGESLVNDYLYRFKDSYVINNFIIKDGKSTAQIDHIFISKKGIFVIETKNYSGNLYGSQDQREWTQVLAYGHTKNKHYNPYMQNVKHVALLSKQTGITNIYNAVVIIKANIRHVQCDCVYDYYDFKKRMKYFMKYNPNIYTDEELKIIINKIFSARANVTNEEHVENVHKKITNIENGICPRCGKPLVLRHRKDGSGSFYGCSGFPKCKFTKKS